MEKFAPEKTTEDEVSRYASRGENPFGEKQTAIMAVAAEKAATTVCLPTLRINDERTNTCDYYSLNSDAVKVYQKNREAVVRINTTDPRADARAGATAGTGFIVDKEGFIATGYHVVRDATSLRVKMADGKVYDAKIVEVDPQRDQALLAIKKQTPFDEFPTVELAENSKDVTSAARMLALGFPQNQDKMHISELNVRTRVPLSRVPITGGAMTGEDTSREVVRMVGNVMHGNSGGALFDRHTGKVVGTIVLSNGFDTYANRIEDLHPLLVKAGLRKGAADFTLDSRFRFLDPTKPSGPSLQTNLETLIPSLGKKVTDLGPLRVR
ncbi:MAG: serine protease [Candidatus Obscuribacterales bacterium]|nr:serine protease [Candidatus Obscuribacterales bacterium]